MTRGRGPGEAGPGQARSAFGTGPLAGLMKEAGVAMAFQADASRAGNQTERGLLPRWRAAGRQERWPRVPGWRGRHVWGGQAAGGGEEGTGRPHVHHPKPALLSSRVAQPGEDRGEHDPKAHPSLKDLISEPVRNVLEHLSVKNKIMKCVCLDLSLENLGFS